MRLAIKDAAQRNLRALDCHYAELHQNTPPPIPQDQIAEYRETATNARAAIADLWSLAWPDQPMPEGPHPLDSEQRTTADNMDHLLRELYFLVEPALETSVTPIDEDRFGDLCHDIASHWRTLHRITVDAIAGQRS